MSVVILLLIFVAAVFFIPPLIGGVLGASTKFTIYYAFAVTLLGYFANIINYIHDGKPERLGISTTDYALSQIVITMISYVGILGLSMLMYLIGVLMRKLLAHHYSET